jgi:hypothetical protein
LVIEAVARIFSDWGFAGNTFTIFWQIAAQMRDKSHNRVSG